MRISCCLIGEDTVLIQCGNVLLTRKHHIEVVVSPNKTIQDWAKKNNIFFVSDIDELPKLNLGLIDYIFSIVNSYILTDSIIKLSRNGAINYHDSRLPRYAGLYSTTWAIINDEKEHGVTWHVVSDKVDEGDIVKQCVFSIYDEDTAFTLNLRCYEQAIKTFVEMITDIDQGTVSLIKQDLQNRSYFGIGYVLPNHGFIDWETFTAHFIVRMNRALTFGHYNNHIGSLKIQLNNLYLIVAQVEVALVENKEHAPGTVLSIENNKLFVSTINQVIKISCFMTNVGTILSVDEVVKQHDIHIGYQFLQIKNRTSQTADNLYSRALKNEPFWIDQLKNATDHAVFSTKYLNNSDGFSELKTAISLDNRFNLMELQTKKNTILAAILIYIFRLNNYEKSFVSIVHDDYANLKNQFNNLFSCFLPFVIGWQSDITFGGVVRYVSKHRKFIEQYKTYLTDLSARHPILKGNILESGIVINITGDQTDIVLPNTTVIYFQYNAIKNEIRVLHRLDLSHKGGELTDFVNNITEHLSSILDKFSHNTHIQANSFCFLTSSERQKLLLNWGQGAVRALPVESISTLFEKQVILQPQGVAIYMGEIKLSYFQLWEMSEKVAAIIRVKNIPKQSLIGIYVARSIEMIAILLGILKADCVYVPLDVTYPLLKIDTIIFSSDLSHVITSDLFIDKLTSHFLGKQGIAFHSIEKILVNQETPAYNAILSNSEISDKLGYIMFTSGTTGAPKGVVVTQKNIINYCLWFSETTDFNENAVIDFSSSIAFDLSVPCTIAPLLLGGKIAICNEAEKTNPQRYLQHLVNHKITHTELTPGYLEMLLNYPDLIKQLVDLKVLLLGADVVPTSDVMKWLALCPNHQIVNEYGPTETTVSATSYFVNTDLMINEAAVPIGRPAFNTTCYILDKYNNLCPIGIKGELYIGGAQVTNGYLGKPLLTQERFITSSFNNHQEIIYKTGDLACWLPDGNLQFFGRNDFQVKIQGYRIELTAIESVLLKIPAIHQAVVVVKKGHFKEKYLRAYLVSDADIPSSSDIRTFLSSHLPNYMVPKEFCVTHAIPLKENEKIDFDALEQQDCQFLTFDEQISDEFNLFEKTSMRIWQQAFNDSEIRIYDDFFDIGGNSLIALQIITELKNHYKVEIPLYFLFDHPTVSLLSSKVSELVNKKDDLQLASNVNHSKTIVKLSTGSYATPLFLVHPVGGSVFWYKQLAKYLDGKYTVYGIQDASIDGANIRFDSLENMASYYIKEIESVYTGERFCLGGASFGATVAFEMAKQVLCNNKEIEFLGLFDGWAEYPQELMKENTFKMLTRHEKGDYASCIESNDYLNGLEEYRKTLLLKYKLTILNANVTLFKAAELWTSFLLVDDPFNGWRSFIDGNLNIYKIQGNHETIFFDPNVSVLAEIINNLIEGRST